MASQPLPPHFLAMKMSNVFYPALGSQHLPQNFKTVVLGLNAQNNPFSLSMNISGISLQGQRTNSFPVTGHVGVGDHGVS